MKQKFLVVYDYGMGGVWAFVSANSKADIVGRFPELKVIETPPATMSREELLEIERTSSFDIDEDPPKWLKK